MCTLSRASVWLVAAAALAGPLGALARPASTICISCDCDGDEERADAEGTEREKSGGRDDGDTCPPDCTHCSCCAGMTAGLAQLIVAVHGSTPSVDIPRTGQSAPANRVPAGVYRPPRSRT